MKENDVKVITRNEIDKTYTDVITSYVQKGYTIHTTTMSGSQGEIAKCDFVDKSKTLYRVIIYAESIRTDNRYARCIFVSVITYEYGKDWRDNGMTVWNSKGKETIIKQYYDIDRYRYGYAFVDNIEDYDAIQEIRTNRWDNRRNAKRAFNLNVINKDNIMKIINARWGYKRVKFEQIENIEIGENGKNKCYTVRIKDKEAITFNL